MLQTKGKSDKTILVCLKICIIYYIIVNNYCGEPQKQCNSCFYIIVILLKKIIQKVYFDALRVTS